MVAMLVLLVATSASADWMTYHGDAQRSGFLHEDVANGAQQIPGRRRTFAGGLTITDPAHQTELERQRARRRGMRHDVEVEIRPLSRYDQLIPA